MKKGGISLLEGKHAESCRALLDQLAAYGIFVVPNGEVESWLPALGGHIPKNDWLAHVFEAMGADPDAAGYVRPAKDDVWEFLRRISKWVHNAARLGMPAT
jgi:methylmalonyl-CoA mutase cobalamin-binding subunit